MTYMKQFRQIASIVGVLSLFAMSPVASFAQTPGANKAANQAARLTTVKARADQDIQNRLTSLNDLSTRVQAMQKLSSDEKSKFSSEIQTDISGLSTLKTKIDADTDLTTLRADAKTIFTSYRIYGIFDPQVRLLAASDRMSVTAGLLSSLADKLQTRIQTVGNPGNAQTLLADMRSKIADANSQYTAVVNAVTALSPASFPATSTLQTARADIKTGAGDLRTALSDARQIRSGLPKQSPAPTTTQ